MNTELIEVQTVRGSRVSNWCRCVVYCYLLVWDCVILRYLRKCNVIRDYTGVDECGVAIVIR